jgi:hypothetical protein
MQLGGVYPAAVWTAPTRSTSSTEVPDEDRRPPPATADRMLVVVRAPDDDACCRPVTIESYDTTGAT